MVLSLSYGLVKAHGGDLTALSSADETVISLALPPRAIQSVEGKTLTRSDESPTA